MTVVVVVTVMQFPSIHGAFPGLMSREGKSIAELVWMLEKAPEELEPYLLSINTGAARQTYVVDTFPSDLEEIPHLREAIIRADTDAALRLNGRRMAFGSRLLPALPQLAGNHADSGVSAATAFVIAVELESGRVLVVELAPFLYLSSGNGLLIIAGLGVLLAGIQNAAFRAVIMNPIRKLEREAEQIGLSDQSGAVVESGPTEMQRIAQALNRMRGRLATLVQEREQMVAAIAHDIRTGMTKIRLRMEATDKVEPADLESHLSQMETLVSDMLTYARAESPSRPQEVIELGQFIASVVDDAPFEVELKASSSSFPFSIVGDPLALRRLFDNLLENARRYGTPPIQVLVAKDEDLVIRIRDHGGGIPVELLDVIFEPFKRGEGSRSRETGGSGLGLGIARAIARAHGAELRLENHAAGGLDALLTFPIEVEA